MNTLDESLAKVARPRNRRIYSRTGLFAKLDRSTKVPGIWVCGPPGSGKTTLISSYAQESGRACLWYQIDSRDSDIATFFWYLRIAAKKIAPASARNLEDYTSAYHGAPEIFAARYFERLYASLPPNFMVVLDDYHLCEDRAELDAIAVQAISLLPQHGNIILVSREQPSPAFCRLLCNEMLQMIDWDDLRLTSEEIHGISLLRQSGHPKSCIRQIEASSDGWAAGLVFQLQHNHPKGSKSLSATGDRHEVLFGYFANEVFDKQESETQTIIMQLSLLPLMTQEMARKLTDRDRAIVILKWMHRNNNFVDVQELEFPVYRFHPLFRNFLRDRLKQSFSKIELQSLMQKAAKLLEESGYAESAGELYRSAGDWHKAASLVIRDAPMRFRQGRLRSLERNIDCFPNKIIADEPWLLYWKGSVSMFLDPQAAHRKFSKAFQLFQQRGDSEGSLAAWSGAVNSLLTEWADMKALDRWIDPGEKLMPADRPPPEGIIGAHAVTAMCSALSICRPHSPGLETFVRETHKLILTSDDQTFRLMACNLLLIFYAWQGKLSQMTLLIDALRPTIEDHDQPDVHRVMWAAAEAWSDLLSDAPEKSLNTCIEGLELSRKCGVHLFDYKFHGVSTQANLILGRTAAAREHIDEYLGVIPGKAKMLHFHVHFLAAWLSWSEGRTAIARQQLATANQFLSSAGAAPISSAKTDIAEAILCIESEEVAEARARLASAYRTANAVGSAWLQYHVLVVKANLEYKFGSKARCLGFLRQSLEIGSAHGLMITDWWDVPVMSRLCEMALENDIEPDHVRRMIAAGGLRPGKGINASTAWPWPVMINVLGDFRLKIGGKVVSSRATSQKKVLELLKALVVFGGEQVPAARLADTLWPDAEGDDARNALKTTVHRLRKLLANAEALEFKEGCLSLRADCCWVDARVFNALARTPRSRPDRGMQLKKALKLYRGPLLAKDEDLHWLIAPRESLQRTAHKITMEIGARYEARGKWGKAIRIYRSGLRQNTLDEQMWRHLMLCLQRSGRHEEAQASYQRCRSELKEHLARNPSAKTKMLAQSINHP